MDFWHPARLHYWIPLPVSGWNHDKGRRFYWKEKKKKKTKRKQTKKTPTQPKNTEQNVEENLTVGEKSKLRNSEEMR